MCLPRGIPDVPRSYDNCWRSDTRNHAICGMAGRIIGNLRARRFDGLKPVGGYESSGVLDENVGFGPLGGELFHLDRQARECSHRIQAGVQLPRRAALRGTLVLILRRDSLALCASLRTV